MNTSKKRVTFSSENSIPLSENNTGIFENSTSDSNKDQSFSSESFSPSVILNGIDSPSDASFSRLVRTQSLNINDIPQLFNGGDKDSNIEKHTFNPYTENETEIINQELNRSIFQEKKQKNRFSIQNSMKKVLGSPIATIKEEFQNIDLSFSPKIRDFRNSRNGWYQLANYSNSSNSNPFNSKQNSNKREMRVSNQKENRIFDSNINSMNNSSFSSNKKERRHRSLRSLLISFLIIVITLLSQMICFQSSFFGVLFGKWTESAEKFHSILNPPQSGYKFKIFSIKKWKRFLNRLNPWQYLILFVHIIQICVLFLFGISFLIAHYSYRSKLSNNAVNQLGYEWFYGTFSQNVYFIANILLIKTFEILFLWSSMFWENSIQILVGYFMSSLSLIIQMILFYLVQRQSNDSFKEWISFSMMITVLICLVINVPVVLRMCFRFGGRMFRIVGVSKLNILLFMNDQYIISILVGDIQFVLTTLLVSYFNDLIIHFRKMIRFVCEIF